MLVPDQPHEALLDRLEQTTLLTRAEAARVVQEVVDYFSEPTAELVRRRHRELHREGLANPAVFDRIQEELPAYRVTAPALTVRQLRRIVYG